jgi:phage-related protein (TIGR01555 family)
MSNLANQFDHLPEQVNDTLTNVVANLGTAKDKRVYSQFTKKNFDRITLEDMYRQDWLAGKIVDIPVDDMTRKWRTVDAPNLSPANMKKIDTLEKDLEIRAKFNEAKKLARVYGSAIIVMGIEGTGRPEFPLNPEKVKVDSLKYLHVLDRTDVSIFQINQDDPVKPNFRQPEWYTLFGGTRIHHSRVIRFDGLTLPWHQQKTNGYWGASILERVYQAVVNSQTVADSVASLIYEAKMDIVKVPNLFQQIATCAGEEALIKRFQTADFMKSFNNMLLLDAEEDHETRQLAFSGLADLTLKYIQVSAAAADIPATRLLGQSAVGMNATGEGDLENYYDSIASKQEVEFGPQLKQLDQVMVRSAIGRMPPDWSFEFNPLWQLSEIERADIDLKNAQRDQVYIAQGVLTPSIIANDLQENGVYKNIPDDYLEALEEIDAEDLAEPEPEPMPAEPVPTPVAGPEPITEPAEPEEEDE